MSGLGTNKAVRRTILKTKPKWDRFGKLTYWEEDDNFVWIYGDRDENHYLKYRKKSRYSQETNRPMTAAEHKKLEDLRSKLRYLEGMDCTVLLRESESDAYNQRLSNFFYDISLDDKVKVKTVRKVKDEVQQLQETQRELIKKIDEREKTMGEAYFGGVTENVSLLQEQLKITKQKVAEAEEQHYEYLSSPEGYSSELKERVNKAVNDAIEKHSIVKHKLKLAQAEMELQIAKAEDELKKLQMAREDSEEKLKEALNRQNMNSQLGETARKAYTEALKIPKKVARAKPSSISKKNLQNMTSALEVHRASKRADDEGVSNASVNLDKLTYDKKEAELERLKKMSSVHRKKYVDEKNRADSLEEQLRDEKTHSLKERIEKLEAEKDVESLKRQLAEQKLKFEGMLRDAINSLSNNETNNNKLREQVKAELQDEDEKQLKADRVYFKENKDKYLNSSMQVLIKGKGVKVRNALALRARIEIPDDHKHIECNFIQHKGTNTFLVRFPQYERLGVVALTYDNKDTYLTTVMYDDDRWEEMEKEIAGENAKRRTDVVRKQFIEWHDEIKTALGL